MSTPSEVYKLVKPSIVAIISKIGTNRQMHEIIGTGFIIRQDGVIFTNKHVIDLFEKLPRHKDMPSNEYPASVLIFVNQEEGMATLSLEIDGIGGIASYNPSGYNYGEDIPDIGVIRVKAKNLPVLQIAEKFSIQEGDEVFTSGFPLGTNLLASHGWVHQVGPTLKRGIVGGVLPFPCSDPHAILLDFMSQGGESGSPVFDPTTGKVFGIIYGGIDGTNISYAVPSNLLRGVFDKLEEGMGPEGFGAEKYELFEELVKNRKKQVILPKTDPEAEVIPPEDIYYAK